MAGFLEGLQNVLGAIPDAFRSVHLQDTMGPDWRQQLQQREFERQRAQQLAQQQDQTFQTQQDTALQQQLANAALGQPQGNDQGPLPEVNLESLIPAEVRDAQRRQRISMAARGLVASSKPVLQQQQAQARMAERQFQAQTAQDLADSRAADAQELAQLRERLARERTLSPADQARLDALASRQQAGFAFRAAHPSAAGGSNIQALPARTADQSPEDYLATLPSDTAQLVQAIAENRVDPSRIASLRGNQRQVLMQAVLQYRPDFQQSEYSQGQRARQEATSGQMSRNLTAINTARRHIETLQGAGEALPQHDYPLLNEAELAIQRATGSPAPTAWDTAASKVADEVTRAFIGTGQLAERNVAREVANLRAAASPAQRQAALDTLLQLLAGREAELQQTYERGNLPVSGLSSAIGGRQAPRNNGGGGDTATFQGHTYRLRPGADRRLRSSWELVQ